jgi:hypothetical protein
MEWKTSTAAWLLDLHSTRGPFEAGLSVRAHSGSVNFSLNPPAFV